VVRPKSTPDSPERRATIINDMKKTKLTIIRSRKWKNFYSPLTISWRREGDNVFEYCKSEGYWRQSKFSVSKLKAKAFTNGLLVEDDIQEGLSYAPNGLHLKA
jgi:hypothetical protein